MIDDFSIAETFPPQFEKKTHEAELAGMEGDSSAICSSFSIRFVLLDSEIGIEIEGVVFLFPKKLKGCKHIMETQIKEMRIGSKDLEKFLKDPKIRWRF